MLLHRASVVCAVTFSVAMCLQLSPCELTCIIHCRKGNRMARNPPHPLSTNKSTPITITRRATSKVGRRKRLESCRSPVTFSSRSIEDYVTSVSDMSESCNYSTTHSNREDEEGAHTLASSTANVDCNDVKNSWTRQGQIPRTRMSESLLPIC